MKIFSACNFCCIHPNALESTFTMEANAMRPEQTAHLGAV